MRSIKISAAAVRNFRIRYGCVMAFLSITAGYATAEVSLSVTADRIKISAGQTITVTVTITSTGQIRDIAPPALPSNEVFDVLRTDKNESHSSSIQIINGKATRKTDISYFFYYTIAPKKTGTFTFPSLTVTVGGKPHTSSPFPVEVIAEPVQNPDVVVSLSTSRQKIYAGEQAILTIRVAHKPNAPVQLSNEGFSDFVQNIEKAMNKNFSIARLTGGRIGQSQEHIHGELYNVFKLHFGLFPLNSGRVTIPSQPFGYSVLRQEQGRSRDPFADFFGGSFFSTRVAAQPRTAASNPLALEIKPLPPAPGDFSGAVGRFTLAANVTPDNIPAGEAVTLTITFTGNTRPGTMGDIEPGPLPDFEVFTPEKQTAVDTTNAGLSTRKKYKYLLIARQEGTARIPPVQWTYFDPVSGAYRTIQTDEFAVTVTKGKEMPGRPSRYLTQSDIQEVGRDIRHLKSPPKLRNQNRKPYRNPLIFGLYLIPLCIVLFSVLFRLQAHLQQKGRAAGLRRKALGKAMRRVRTVKKTDSGMPAEQFLGKVHSLLDEYILDKFGFAATGRTVDEQRDLLREHGIEPQTLDTLKAFHENMEALRFSGRGADSAEKNRMLDQCLTLLKRLDIGARKEKKR